MGISSALGSSALLPAGLGFRNMVINGGFDIWQRGTSFTNPASSTGFTADRFFPVYDGSGATRVLSQGQFDPFLSGASITASPPSGTAPTYFLRWNQTVAGTGATYNILYNRVENVRLLAGQTVTLSFYAKAASNLTMPTIDIEQYFGAGGSPSANVYTTVTSNVAVTTSWQRFTFTFQIPSAAGKVIGTTENSSYTSIRLFLPINTTFTYDIWGLQLERNTQATPFEQRPIGVELQLCQRYFQRIGTDSTDTGAYMYFGSGWLLGTNYLACGFSFPKMRIGPAVTSSALNTFYIDAATGNGVTAGSWAYNHRSATSVRMTIATPSAATGGQAGNLLSNNTATAYFFLDSEL